jgi:hypothetical protein
LLAYSDLHRLFRYAEGIKLCREALETGPKTTHEIAAYIAKAKGLDAGDAVLRKVLCSAIIHQLRRQARSGRLLVAGKRQAAIIWQLPKENTLI